MLSYTYLAISSYHLTKPVKIVWMDWVGENVNTTLIPKKRW
jgi:hypothetical protein